MSAIDRIHKLIALSGSENEHEARSAAFLACKLIREGAYRVVAAPVDAWADHHAPAWTWGASPAPAERPRRPPPDTRPRRSVSSEIGRAKRSGLCAVCGEAFEQGSDVARPTLAGDEKLGPVHADCRAGWTVPVDR